MGKGSTPEGRVKAAIRKVLKRYEPMVYHHWPVPYGYGNSTVDVIGIAGGTGFAVEAKAPGGVPTDRQDKILRDIAAAGGKAFVIDSADGTEPLERWLQDAVQKHRGPTGKRKAAGKRR